MLSMLIKNCSRVVVVIAVIVQEIYEKQVWLVIPCIGPTVLLGERLNKLLGTKCPSSPGKKHIVQPKMLPPPLLCNYFHLHKGAT